MAVNQLRTGEVLKNHYRWTPVQWLMTMLQSLVTCHRGHSVHAGTAYLQLPPANLHRKFITPRTD